MNPPDLPFLLVGTDHRTSPIDLREKVSYDKEEATETLVHLLAREEIAEACLLSTCNRTEAYVVARHPETAYRTALDLVFIRRNPLLEQPGHLYVKGGDEAATHLLRVASGLESMVLGEPEILGQVKSAAQLASSVGAAGPLLGKLQLCASRAGRRARAETRIASGSVSLGYSVVELARNIFHRLEDLRILVLGAGETARLVCHSLIEKGARSVQIANRTATRSERLQEEIPQVVPVPFGDLAARSAECDLVVATTSSDEALLRSSDFTHRRHRPLLLIDLGVPRNIDPALGRRENIFLHTIDSLDTLIQRNLKRRREEVPQVEELVREELEQFLNWFRSLAAEPLVARLQKQAEAIRQRELEGARQRFPRELHEDLDRLTRSLVRKILHNPSAHLRGKGGPGALPDLDLVRELFRLDGDD
ncbi:MAG: glutamyl-tRNA reductase [Acidobacteriota bacterium]